MKFGSVASGIEAASAAWEPLGWHPQFYSEIEPFPCHVLHHRWSSCRPRHMPDPLAPDLTDDERKERRNAIKAVNKLPVDSNGPPNLGDMTQFQEWPDYAIDLLVGGTPCQTYSVAGLRAGLDDPRGDLTLTYAAIARRYRPSWLVWENVVGVLSHDGGRSFASLLGLLSGQRIEVPAGGWKTAGFIEGYKSAYGLAWRVLDTQYVRTQRHPWARPQRRRRVFIVGYLGNWRRAAAVLLEREGLSGNPPPRREAGKNVAGTISARAGASRSGGLGTDFDLDGGLVAEAAADPVALAIDASMGRRRGSGMNANQIVGVPEVGNTLTARMAKGVNTTMDEGQTMVPVQIEAEAAATLRGEGFDATEDGSGRTTLVPVAFNVMPMNSGKDFKGREAEVAQPLMAAGPQTNAAQGGDFVVQPVAPTLRAGGNSTGGDRPPGSDVDTLESLIGIMPEVADPLVAKEGETYTHEGRGNFRVRNVVPAIAFQPRFARNDRGGPSEVAYPLTAEAGRTGKGDSAQVVAFDLAQITSPDNRSQPAPDKPSPTMSEGSQLHVTNGWRVRRLTPTECARLQGQADNHCAIPWGGKPADECPDGPQYKAYGNSMSTNVMEWLGVRIQMVQDLIDEGAI
jgi:DNA (cytosine-5)-methyltransferase 1